MTLIFFYKSLSEWHSTTAAVYAASFYIAQCSVLCWCAHSPSLWNRNCKIIEKELEHRDLCVLRRRRRSYSFPMTTHTLTLVCLLNHRTTSTLMLGMLAALSPPSYTLLCGGDNLRVVAPATAAMCVCLCAESQ